MIVGIDLGGEISQEADEIGRCRRDIPLSIERRAIFIWHWEGGEAARSASSATRVEHGLGFGVHGIFCLIERFKEWVRYPGFWDFLKKFGRSGNCMKAREIRGEMNAQRPWMTVGTEGDEMDGEAGMGLRSRN